MLLDVFPWNFVVPHPLSRGVWAFPVVYFRGRRRVAWSSPWGFDIVWKFLTPENGHGLAAAVLFGRLAVRQEVSNNCFFCPKSNEVVFCHELIERSCDELIERSTIAYLHDNDIVDGLLMLYRIIVPPRLSAAPGYMPPPAGMPPPPAAGAAALAGLQGLQTLPKNGIIVARSENSDGAPLPPGSPPQRILRQPAANPFATAALASPPLLPMMGGGPPRGGPSTSAPGAPAGNKG